MLLNYRKIMVLYNARLVFGVFPSFPPASAQGKEGSAHKNMMTVKGYLIYNSAMLQFTFRFISKDENEKCKKADAPMNHSHRPKKPANIRLFFFFFFFLLVVMNIICNHSWVKWPCNRHLSAPAGGGNATPGTVRKFGNLFRWWQTRRPNRAS